MLCVLLIHAHLKKVIRDRHDAEGEDLGIVEKAPARSFPL